MRTAMHPAIKYGTLLLALLVISLFVSPNTATAESKAVVSSPTLKLHIDASDDSAVIATLSTGDTVVIDSKTEDGSWCFVREEASYLMGYVPCSGLTHKTEAGWWDRMVNGIKGVGGHKETAAHTDYSQVHVILYMTDW